MPLPPVPPRAVPMARAVPKVLLAAAAAVLPLPAPGRWRSPTGMCWGCLAKRRRRRPRRRLRRRGHGGGRGDRHVGGGRGRSRPPADGAVAGDTLRVGASAAAVAAAAVGIGRVGQADAVAVAGVARVTACPAWRPIRLQTPVPGVPGCRGCRACSGPPTVFTGRRGRVSLRGWRVGHWLVMGRAGPVADGFGGTRAAE